MDLEFYSTFLVYWLLKAFLQHLSHTPFRACIHTWMAEDAMQGVDLFIRRGHQEGFSILLKDASTPSCRSGEWDHKLYDYLTTRSSVRAIGVFLFYWLIKMLYNSPVHTHLSTHWWQSRETPIFFNCSSRSKWDTHDPKSSRLFSFTSNCSI